MGIHRWLACVAGLVMTAGCGSAAPDAQLPSEGTVGAQVETLAPPSSSPTTASPAPSGACAGSALTDGIVEEAQFAFVGSVVAAEELIHPWTTDPENTNRPEAAVPTTWVTFDVDRWYFNDWGTTFSVWMPDFDVVVGQRLAVGGNAYHTEVGDFSGQSGEVEFCSPVTDDEMTPAEWDARFGEPFAPAPASASTTTAPAPATKVFGDQSSPCAPTVLSNGPDDPEMAETGATCLLSEIEAGRPVVWDVLMPTVEGDPIVTRYEFDGATVTITADYSFDTFGSGGVIEQRCAAIRPSRSSRTAGAYGWLPEGVSCTTSSGEGFQPDSVSTAQSNPTGLPRNFDDVDALIPVVEFDGAQIDVGAPYFGSQNAAGGPAQPSEDFVPAVDDQVFCWAVAVINSRPQPRDEYQEIVVANQYFVAIQPFAVAEVATELDALVDFTDTLVAQGSFTDGDEAEPGDAAADALHVVSTFVDQRCHGLA